MVTRFTACQTVEMTVSDQPFPIQHYLRQPQRVVTALAASSQIEILGDELFRLKMRPLTFMTLTIQPIVDLKVWAEADGTVHVESSGCEIRGVDYINRRFTLTLVGKLQPYQIAGTTQLRGQADLSVQVDVPPPLAFTPKPLMEATGNSLLKSVLMTIKQRLMHHLLADYRKWAASKPESAVTTPARILPSSPPLA